MSLCHKLPEGNPYSLFNEGGTIEVPDYQWNIDKLWFIDLANPGLILAHPLVDHVPDEKLSFHIYIPF